MKSYNKGAGFDIRHKRTYMPKRNIPVFIILRIWFGNPLSIIGLFFFLFGLPFTFIFISFSDILGPSFNESDPQAKGTIVEVIPSNSYINDVRVYEYKFQYKLRDGNIYVGSGFSTGQIKNLDDEVIVQFKENKPEVSMAIGLRNSAFGAGVGLFTLIFPGIGFVMMFFSTRKALRQIMILRVGKLTEGKFLYKEATNMQINKQTVFALTFEFVADDNTTHQTVAKTHQYYRLTDEAMEKLVYDPDNPQNAVLLDELPYGIKNYFLKNFGSLS
jgi:hypothetical protein